MDGKDMKYPYALFTKHSVSRKLFILFHSFISFFFFQKNVIPVFTENNKSQVLFGF